MFEENLINAIEMHRCIWDKSQLSYRDKNKKCLAWRDVSTLVGESETDCRKRWKSLRDRYSIELKQQHQPTGSAPSFRRNWVYFDALSFLKGTIIARKSTTNIKAEIEPESSFSFELNRSGELVLNSQTEESESVSTKRKRLKEDEDSSSNSLVEDVSGWKSQKISAHDNFLGAIGDIFQKVPPEQQIDFKMDVLQYVYGKFKSLSAD